MKIVPYTGEHWHRLEAAVRRAGTAHSLLHREFVEWYYGTRDWCRLWLGYAKDGTLAAAVGIEEMPFEIGGAPVTVAAASNFVTFLPGAGGLLFLHWVRTSEHALVFGGSPDTHRILESQRGRWTYFAGVRVLTLNGRFAVRRRRGWRALAAAVFRRVGPWIDPARAHAGLVERGIAPAVRAEELDALAASALPAPPSPFTLRLAPSLPYLRWRYDPTLAFVRYRIVRLVDEERGPRGYVVLNDHPERLIVAQADGDDPRVLASGVLAAVALATREERERRPVVLASAHPAMRRVFQAAGFVPDPADRPFALGTGRKPVALAPDTSDWLVNYDWIDNGLRF